MNSLETGPERQVGKCDDDSQCEGSGFLPRPSLAASKKRGFYSPLAASTAAGYVPVAGWLLQKPPDF